MIAVTKNETNRRIKIGRYNMKRSYGTKGKRNIRKIWNLIFYLVILFQNYQTGDRIAAT